METKDCLANYYEGYDEDGRLISKHGMVEYLTTMICGKISQAKYASLGDWRSNRSI